TNITHTLTLHDALPIWEQGLGNKDSGNKDSGNKDSRNEGPRNKDSRQRVRGDVLPDRAEQLAGHNQAQSGGFMFDVIIVGAGPRSEEHTSELQSREKLV